MGNPLAEVLRCARRTAEDAGRSKVAERIVSGALPARVRRGPLLRAAELAWANWAGLKREAQQHAQRVTVSIDWRKSRLDAHPIDLLL
jgi:hypothetical protein